MGIVCGTLDIAMFHGPKIAAPEPFASAALWVMYRAILEIRNNCNAMSKEQLSDLGEALHNIPISLTEYGRPLDEDAIRDYLSTYDAKWAKSQHDMSLIASLDGSIDRVRSWLNRGS